MHKFILPFQKHWRNFLTCSPLNQSKMKLSCCCLQILLPSLREKIKLLLHKTEHTNKSVSSLPRYLFFLCKAFLWNDTKWYFNSYKIYQLPWPANGKSPDNLFTSSASSEVVLKQSYFVHSIMFTHATTWKNIFWQVKNNTSKIMAT